MTLREDREREKEAIMPGSCFFISGADMMIQILFFLVDGVYRRRLFCLDCKAEAGSSGCFTSPPPPFFRARVEIFEEGATGEITILLILFCFTQ